MYSAGHFCPILNKLGFSRQIFIAAPLPLLNFTKTRPVGAALIHTDMTKVMDAFRGYANAPKNGFLLDSMRGNVCGKGNTWKTYT
jgi:hypothetical protein